MSPKVALIGATGQVGSRILAELTRRGYSTLAIARHVDRLPADSRAIARQVDGTVADLTRALSGQDIVISAARFMDLDPDLLLPAVLASGAGRLVVSGGAGVLLNRDGIRVADAPSLPEAARPNSQRGVYLFNLLQNTPGLAWTYVAPALNIVPGERTGAFRIGRDQALYDPTGRSVISYEDLAMAVVDEMEAGNHVRQLFTVAY